MAYTLEGGTVLKGPLSQIIPKILEDYDKNNEIHSKEFDNVVHSNMIKPATQEPILILYDKDMNEIKRYKYSIIGLFLRSQNIWTWGWAVPYWSINIASHSRKLLNYGLDIEVTAQKNQVSSFLKTQLITSRFILNDPLQLDIYIALAAALTKQTNIYAWYSPSDLNEIITKQHDEESKRFVDVISNKDKRDAIYLILEPIKS